MASIGTLLTPQQLLGGGGLGDLQAAAGDGDVSPRSPRSPRTPGGSLRARVSGVVKFYNPHSSFGYIVQDDGSDDVYVHAKALGAVPGGVLGAGDKVEYRVAVFNLIAGLQNAARHRTESLGVYVQVFRAVVLDDVAEG